MNKKHNIKISKQANYFYEAVILAERGAQWKGDFNKEDFHLVENSERFNMTQEEIDKEFEDVYNFQVSIMSEAVPIFKKDRFWNALTKVSKDSVFSSSYLSAWSQNSDISSINDIDMDKFLYMNLSIFEDVYYNEGTIDGDLLSLEKHSFRNSSWKDEIDIELEDILWLIENAGFLLTTDIKYEIIKIYIDKERAYKKFQEKLGLCEDIVKRHYHLVEDRFNKIASEFDKDKGTREFFKMTNVMSLKEIYSEEISIGFSSVQYNGGSVRISSKENLGTKALIGIMLFDLHEYSKSFENSKEKIIEKCKAIGDETRFSILSKICEKPYYVKELAEEMDLTSASISHHLSILFQAGFIEPTVKDRKTFYNIKDGALIELGQELIKIGNTTSS